ncbi:MAG: threonine--tRNA ligase [Candidatus Vogelbacteria bacterium RIFOXYD1_FULL_44_32]|uniref:Threonine--tRNA ligase n=1 Tax=Candidatus Vogelbacteria bacterium RIFOXYD1_FULL_44_32 TaxID=1802438 RepID=A0A1G2QE59_9BACT|nr:MAG: threonine--tRNA ligase [Candidatus Vogelbacteria bacterium RIFOXYD1_FULL_44_32]
MSNADILANKRHTLAHLLAATILELYPDAKNTIGPAIDNGFYYDFEFTSPLSENDLVKIETKMREILPSWSQFKHREVTDKEAKVIYTNNPYKLELIDEIVAKGEPITLYTIGNFTDLCRGGHSEAPNTDIDPAGFKLDRLAGAYWRGDSNNTMLTRIYGLAFDNQVELEDYVAKREEAEKRDHRKLGKELNLFFVDDTVGKGLIMWLPNGTIMRNEIEKLAIAMEDKGNYQRVSTPHLAKEELFLRSGHLPYYKDGMYPPMVMDDGTYYLRAMNCPHHHTIYLHLPHSYRELPIRYAEYGTVYRNELSGTLAGLLRVRGLAMNDAHIYCRKDQIKDEFKNVMALVMEYFKIFNLSDYWFRLSKWSPEHLDKYINEPANWDFAETVLREVLVELGVKFTEVEDEAAFYGPKVDVQFKSAIGREETMSTIQLDFVAKTRFGLTYIDNEGKDNNEVFVIHRAPLSTHERFMAFLIEHYAGAFPTWLSPVQVAILPVAEAHDKFAEEVVTKLKEAGVRVEYLASGDSLGKRIRSVKTSKVPYFVVIGDKEKDSGNLTIENRAGDKEEILTEKLVEKLQTEIKNRS